MLSLVSKPSWLILCGVGHVRSRAYMKSRQCFVAAKPSYIFLSSTVYVYGRTKCRLGRVAILLVVEHSNVRNVR